jgi:RNA polymerase sigma-70 factor (ECF subfamily)
VHPDEGASDESLLHAFLSGDHQAFTTLVRRHEDRIFALALRMTGSRADALDATQEAFLTMFRRAASFRGESAFGTWLYRIGINACHDLLRRRTRRDENEEERLDVEDERASRIDEATALRVDLARALAELSEEYREAVVMHDLGGIPYEEIARLTGAAIGTVKSRISRGRRRLAEVMEQASDSQASKDRI